MSEQKAKLTLKTLLKQRKVLIPITLVLVFITIYLISVLTVILMAPDEIWTQFPDSCPGTPNCTRVADSNVRGEGLSPPILNASISQVHDVIVEWINDQPRSKILNDQADFIHAVFKSFTFRFPDDFAVKIKENENGSVTLWVQSQARVGYGDMNVNDKRVRAFVEYMNAYKF